MRQQLAKAPLSLFGTTRDIAAREGIKGLYRGCKAGPHKGDCHERAGRTGVSTNSGQSEAVSRTVGFVSSRSVRMVSNPLGFSAAAIREFSYSSLRFGYFLS